MKKKKAAAIVLCLALSTGTITGCMNNGFHLNRDDMSGIITNDGGIEPIYTNEELLNEFLNIYNSNENMQHYWGCIYNELTDFISNNGQYLDQQQLIDTLPELKFEEVDQIAFSDNALASYNYNSNTISFASRFFYKSPEQQKEITLHETFHYLFFQQFSGTLGSGAPSLNEGTASLFTREYNAYVGVDAYEKNAYYVRVICELIGSENYLTAFGDHDYNELIGYLANYSSRRDADSLISSINSACTDTRMNTESDQDAREILEEIYFNKNGVSVEESNDNVMKCYFNKLFQTEYEIEGARFSYHASVNKNYLVNTDMVPNITFSKQNKLYGTVYLGDNNEVVSGEVLAEGFYNEVGEVVDLDGNEIEEEIISYSR